MPIINKPTLESVKNQFQIWRNNRKRKNEPIPDNLWKSVAGLMDLYRLTEITKTLRLNSNDLKKHAARLKIEAVEAKPNMEEEVEFVELNPLPIQNINSQCTIEIEKPDGMKMKISVNGMTAVDIAKLTQSLWRD